jgi:hypothetical protein
MKALRISALFLLIVFANSVLALSIDGPTCYKTGKGKCFITFNSVSVQASDLVFMRVSVDDEIVAQTTAFFVTSMSVPGDRFGEGFPVDCGAAGEGGYSTLGARHSLINEPLDSDENSVGGTSIALVWCPAK